MTADRTATATADRPAVDHRRLGRALWAVVLVATPLDVATTVYALEFLAAVEGNPFVRAVLAAAGYPGFVAAKLAALAVGAAIYHAVPRTHQPAVPFGLAVPTVAAVAVNATLFV